MAPGTRAQALPDSGVDLPDAFLTNLNRPATAPEIKNALSMLQAIPAEHQQLAVELQRYEQELVPVSAQREQQRQATIVYNHLNQPRELVKAQAVTTLFA